MSTDKGLSTAIAYANSVIEEIKEIDNKQSSIATLEHIRQCWYGIAPGGWVLGTFSDKLWHECAPNFHTMCDIGIACPNCGKSITTNTTCKLFK